MGERWTKKVLENEMRNLDLTKSLKTCQSVSQKTLFFFWIRASFGYLALIDSWDSLEWKGADETTLPQQNIGLFCF